MVTDPIGNATSAPYSVMKYKPYSESLTLPCKI